MAPKTCFVIMPIGDQEFGNMKLTGEVLKQRYDDLIKEAILKADPSIEVLRADEVSMPGPITTEILTRIMHSDLVVADVTYPNPNVFYELGLRHACRVGTIIIRDRNGPKSPFDIAHLRHIEYENTATGFKALAQELKKYFDHFDQNPTIPDNQLLELAKFTDYCFPSYRKNDRKQSTQKMVSAILESPELLQLMVRQMNGETVEPVEMIKALMAGKPETARKVLAAVVEANAPSE